ncbi:putative lipoprotein [Enhygromyxa salina]|uniref:Putative lipoprotein n=1 Tax=Enhygromyxa salina TaxID=215803 RepID=A0A0C1ZD13_9BACT|nr:hypothetical protein [Enhygromyxa salina]KIG15584.1 putative lipoprotein [Enhygromyxa salina]
MAIHPPDVERERPAGVPASAWWSDEDNEWILGPKDANGELHGEVHYWRPDGSLCCITQLRHGVPHGSFERFHETGEVAQFGQYENGELHGQRTFVATTGDTSEDMHAGGRLSPAIVRSEYDYVHGTLASVRHFGADQVRLDSEGAPLRERPVGVPAHAILNAKSGNWLVGVWDSEGRRDGPLECFASDGRRLAIESYRADQAHGLTTLFFPEGGKRATLEYANDALHGVAEQYYRNGVLARRAHFEQGAWAGPLTDWSASGERSEERTIPAPAPAPELRCPSEPTLRAAGREDLDVDDIAALGGGPISAPGLAQLLAIGWGGDEHRDAELARAARRIVRERDDPALVAALRETGLLTAPRLLTCARVERVIEAIGPVDAVDSEALVDALAQRGGVGTAAIFNRGDAAAVSALAARVRDDRLDLRGLGLSRLPRSVGQLPTLRELDASGNAIETVPAEVGQVFFLRKLKLNHNRLTTLPVELARLRDLRGLHLADNRLSSLPEVVTALVELDTLGLGGNELQALPEDFGQLARLETLWLHDNSLAQLPDSFARLSALRFLHLGGLPWATPPPVIYELSSLRELWIASRSLTYLPADIARLTGLSRLIIWSSGLTALPETLFEMTTLRELRVRNNPLPAGTIDRLKEALPDCTIY